MIAMNTARPGPGSPVPEHEILSGSTQHHSSSPNRTRPVVAKAAGFLARGCLVANSNCRASIGRSRRSQSARVESDHAICDSVRSSQRVIAVPRSSVRPSVVPRLGRRTSNHRTASSANANTRPDTHDKSCPSVVTRDNASAATITHTPPAAKNQVFTSTPPARRATVAVSASTPRQPPITMTTPGADYPRSVPPPRCVWLLFLRPNREQTAKHAFNRISSKTAAQQRSADPRPGVPRRSDTDARCQAESAATDAPSHGLTPSLRVSSLVKIPPGMVT